MSSKTSSSKQASWHIENITVPRSPLLKIYYWESFDIDLFNEKLFSDFNMIQHNIHIPATQINSKPLKTIFWLRNCSQDKLELKIKRIKNCDCVPQQTRVGYNQYRQLYHCPHRRLVHIMQEVIQMNPDELVALSIVSYFFLFGEYKLIFEIHCSDSRLILLNFFLDIIGFDPEKCILTKELQPVDIKEPRRFLQPIWVYNITSQHINFVFGSRVHGLKLINPQLTVPRQSVWPLMVEYRALNPDTNLEFSLSMDNADRGKFLVRAQALHDSNIPEPQSPLKDYECADFLYVIYPNKLDFCVEYSEEHSKMVCVHNYNQKCCEFRWQSYVINDLIEISFQPNIFRLKPHHSQLCVIQLRVFERALNFKRIPAVLEVHRIFDKATKIAKELLTEIESIDDPKWKEDSYMEHVFLQLNIKVKFKADKPPAIPTLTPTAVAENIVNTFDRSDQSDGLKLPALRTIFEKLFWEQLSHSKFMRENTNPEISDTLSYDEIIEQKLSPASLVLPPVNVSNDILKITSQMMAEGLRDLSKSWVFIPRDVVFRKPYN